MQMFNLFIICAIMQNPNEWTVIKLCIEKLTENDLLSHEFQIWCYPSKSISFTPCFIA